MSESRLVRFQGLMRRLSGVPESDDFTYRGVMAWRTPVVEMAMLVPLFSAVATLWTWAVRWDRLDYEVAPLVAGVFIVAGWPWTKQQISIRWLWPRRIAGVVAVLVGGPGMADVFGVGRDHDLASFTATAGGALLACYLFAASTRWPAVAIDRAPDGE